MKDKRESRYDKRQSPSRKRSTSSNDDKQRSPSSFDERNNDDSQDNDDGMDKKRADEPEEEEEGSEEGEIRNKEDDEPRSAVDGRHGNNTDDDGRFGNNADDKKRHRKAPSRRFYNTRSSAAKRAAARKSSSRSASPPTSPAPRSKKDTTATVNGYTSDHNKDETGSYASSHGPTSPERKRSMSPNYSSTRRRNVYNYRGGSRGRRGTNRGFRGGYNYSQYSRHGRRGAPKTPSLSPPPLDDEAENTTSAQNKGVETNDMSARTESKSKSNSFNTSHNANISNSNTNTNTNNNRDIESPLDEYEEDEEDLQKLGLLKNINAANYKANAKESANQASLHHHDEPPPPPPHKEDINGPMEKSTTSGIRYHIKGLATNNKSSSTTINHKYRAEGEGWNIPISPSNRRSASPGSHHPAHNEAGGENDGASDAEYRDESRYKHGGSGSHKPRNHSPSRGSYPHYKGNRDRYASMNGTAGHHNKYRSYNQRKSGEYRSNNTSSNKYGVEDEGGKKSTMSGGPHKYANRGGAGKGRRYPTKEYSDRSRSGSETRSYHNHQSKRHHASSDKMGNMAGETYSRSQSRTPSSPRGPPDPESLKLGSIFKKQKTLEELAKHKQLQSQQLMMMDAAAKQSGDHQFANNPESESFLKSAMDTANTASVKRFQMLTNPSLAKESNYYGNDTAININKSMESNNKSGQSGASQSSQQSKININFKNFQSNYSAPDDINMNTMETQNFNNFNASSNIQLSAHDAEMLVASTTNYKNQSNINAPTALLDDFDGDDDWRTMAGKSSGNMNKSGGTTVSTADKLNQELEARLKEVTGNDKAVANQNKRKRVESAEFDSNDLMDNQNTNLSSKNISSGPGGAYKFKTQAVVDTFKHYLEQAYREDCNTLYGVSKVLICDDNLRASILKSADDNVKQLASKALNDLADIFKRVKTQTMET